MCADKAVESAVTWSNTAQAPSAVASSASVKLCSEPRINGSVKAAAMVRRGGTLLHLELGWAAARSVYGRAAAVSAVAAWQDLNRTVSDIMVTDTVGGKKPAVAYGICSSTARYSRYMQQRRARSW